MQSTNLTRMDESPEVTVFPVGPTEWKRVNVSDVETWHSATLRWTNQKPPSHQAFLDSLQYVNPGITNSFRLKVIRASEGPFRLQFDNEYLWGNGKRWVTADSGAKWHDKGIPKYFVKLTGMLRKGIEKTIQAQGVDPDSLLAKLLPEAEAEFDNVRIAANAKYGKCASFMAEAGCSWTLQYSCPGQISVGAKGQAQDDDSHGYYCCCTLGFFSA